MKTSVLPYSTHQRDGTLYSTCVPGIPFLAFKKQRTKYHKGYRGCVLNWIFHHSTVGQHSPKNNSASVAFTKYSTYHGNSVVCVYMI